MTSVSREDVVSAVALSFISCHLTRVRRTKTKPVPTEEGYRLDAG